MKLRIVKSKNMARGTMVTIITANCLTIHVNPNDVEIEKAK